MSRRRLAVLLPALASLVAAGCSGTPAARPSGGYYGGDRPPQRLPVDPDSVADAVPRREPLSATGNAPYTALGKRYRPLKSAGGYVARGTASWYGSKFHGRRTSSGEPYDMFAMTAAHPVLPLPTYVRVTNLDNGKSVVVRVNDRGPFLHGRIIDLSYIAAHKLGIAARGKGRVEVRALTAGGDAAADHPVSRDAADAAILIQIGAYTNRGNARDMRRRIERAGYRVAPPAGGGQDREKPYYRVRVGPFANLDTARIARRNLESLLGHRVMLVIQ